MGDDERNRNGDEWSRRNVPFQICLLVYILLPPRVFRPQSYVILSILVQNQTPSFENFSSDLARIQLIISLVWIANPLRNRPTSLLISAFKQIHFPSSFQHFIRIISALFPSSNSFSSSHYSLVFSASFLRIQLRLLSGASFHS